MESMGLVLAFVLILFSLPILITAIMAVFHNLDQRFNITGNTGSSIKEDETPRIIVLEPAPLPPHPDNWQFIDPIRQASCPCIHVHWILEQAPSQPYLRRPASEILFRPENPIVPTCSPRIIHQEVLVINTRPVQIEILLTSARGARAAENPPLSSASSARYPPTQETESLVPGPGDHHPQRSSPEISHFTRKPATFILGGDSDSSSESSVPDSQSINSQRRFHSTESGLWSWMEEAINSSR